MVFLSISNGKLVRQLKEKTDNSVSRVNKVGREVHELFYDSLEGVIKSIGTKESDYGKFWVLKLESGGIVYQLEFNYSGGYAASFLKALPNADLTRQLILIPKLTVEGDKKKSVLFISQDGKGLKFYFTKDTPNGMPELQKIKVKGKETWDDSERMEFLEKFATGLFTTKVEEDTPF